jgi:ubiquinone/menaquinone biosynthesis C-methylase UbiE
MGLKHSYTLLSPIYDAVVSTPTRQIRRDSLQRIKPQSSRDILLNGIGTGLDIPFLPPGPRYTGTDITPAMLRRAQRRASQHAVHIDLQQADSMQLPFDDAIYDIVIMHLILAVVPNPLKALQESSRVLKPGGKIFILDKFIQPGETALLRRLINPLIRHLATRTDVVFEQLHPCCKELTLIENRPVLLGGWFRSIELEKEHSI